MDSTPGKYVGRYQLLDRIGVGGMGEVYLAHDPYLDRRVAIKLLPPHLAADVVARERLRREALAAAALDHPFICKVFEVSEQSSAVFLVMEYVRGETLHAHIRTGRLPMSEALRIAGEIAEAIEEAHSNNVIHRDLKPANIMVTGQGHVKVMDFGLAKRTRPSETGETCAIDQTPLTGRGTSVGTPNYMSPEQLTGAPVDQRSDLFSFGIVLCELLVGRHPFQRKSTLETMAAILRDTPDLTSPAGSPASPGLMVLIRRLLAKPPEERYASMRDVRADMARLHQNAAESGPEAAPAMALIGRDQERDQLLRLLEAAMAGRGALVLIGGEPGIGKTHLTQAILAEGVRRGCFGTLGHCYEMEGAPPYVPFIETLEYCARAAPRESFRAAIGDAAPEVAKLMPELHRIFPDIPPPVELPPEQQRRFLFNAYREFVERSARITPIVSIFEDLHWADESTLLLLKHLAQTVSTIPALLIATYRDVDQDAKRPFAGAFESLIRERATTRISLRRLALPGVQAMLAELSGQAPPPSLASGIFAETEGNPFFVEEVFHHLREEGKLFDDHGAWRTGLRADVMQVPQSVRLVIGRRLDRLGEQTRRVLTTAAVIGRSFNLRALEELESARPDAALDAMEEAETAQLVTAERNGRELRYRFVHELVRQTLAESLSIPRCQRLHARIADAIERTCGANVESQASALAYHLYQAGAAADLDKTVTYLMMAARLATTGAAHEEALTHIDNALSLVGAEQHPRTGELHAARAVALRSLFRFAEAVESYERAIACFVETGNLAGAAEVGFHLGYIHLWNADMPRALAVVDRAIQLIGAQPSPLLLWLVLGKAVHLGAKGDMEAAFAALAEAQQIGAALPAGPANGFPSMCQARVLYMAAQFEKADECARAALERFRGTGDLWGQAELFELISAPLVLGHPADFDALLRESLARAEKVGHLHAVWVAKVSVAQVLTIRGDLEGADRVAREAHDFALSIGSRWAFLDNLYLGSIAHYRGQFDEALRWIRQGIEVEPPSGFGGQLRGALFWTLAAQGDPASGAALAAARAYLPVPGRPFSIGSCGCLPFVVEGLALLGRFDEAAALEPHAEHVVANGPLCVFSQHLFRTSAGIAAACAGHWERAEEHHRMAIQQADAAPYRVAQPIARSWYAEMLLSRDLPGDRERAHELLREALHMYQAIGMAWHARRAAGRLGGG